MGKKAKVGSRPNEFKYGMALYGAAWPPGDHFFVCGGGGHGLVNRVVWARYAGGRCSDQVGECKLGAATPMRMALAPSGSALLLGMSDGSLRRFHLDTGALPSSAAVDNSSSGGAAAALQQQQQQQQPPRVVEVTAAFGERVRALQGEVTCMAFSGDAKLLALGYADGAVRVVEYPAMRLAREWRLADGARDLDFAHEGGATAARHGPLLATTTDGGACQIWAALSGRELCRLAPPKGLEKAQLARCRFSRAAPILYVALNLPRAGCHMAAYGAPEMQRRGSIGGGGGGGGGAAPAAAADADAAPWAVLVRREVDAGPNAALEISRSGALLALGQAEGGLLVVDARNLVVIRSEPQASMVFVTRVAFADDERAVLAVGADANAFVLDLRRGGFGGGGGGGGGAGAVCALLLLLLVLSLLAVALAVYADPEARAQADALLGAARRGEHGAHAAAVAAQLQRFTGGGGGGGFRDEL